MRKSAWWCSLTVFVGLIAGTAAAENMPGMMAGHQMPDGTKASQPAPGHEQCLGHLLGVTYRAENIRDGAVLTMTSKDPTQAKKIQEETRRFAEIKDVSAPGQAEMVTCAVTGTKMPKSKAYDSTVYKGKTYYFCCAGCKPEFLKDPEKYVKKLEQAVAGK